MKRAILFAALASAAFSAEKPAEKLKLPASAADLARGKKLFEVHCALCHGPKGEGGRGPMLAQPRLRRATDDAALVKILEEGIRGTEMPGADSMTNHEVRQTAAYVRSLGKVAAKPVPGNAEHGAELYRSKGCAGCHSIKGEGGVVGPDLATIGTARSATYLREALENPSSAVPDGYLLVKAVTKGGETVTGARLNEDSFSIQILDNAGRPHSYWKQDIAELDKQKGRSPMPSYKGQLSETELTDLVAYLASLKEAQ
jgi:putative heme-binding domain-containing protein